VEELKIAGVRALADLGGHYLEVRGTIVMRVARRLSDYANHPDPMLELDGAALRFHLPGGPELWEEVEGLSLNRDRVLLLIPVDENDPGHNPEMHVRGRSVRVKVICRGLQLTGFVRVPVNATIASFIHESHNRFLAVTQARVIQNDVGTSLGDFEGMHPFCLVNRSYIVACIETRAREAPQPVAPEAR
jgi:hypothetical protein